MASVAVTISGMLYDKINRTSQNVVLIGEGHLTDLSVGGGPILPPDQPPPGGPSVGLPIWGPPGYGPGAGFPDRPGYPTIPELPPVELPPVPGEPGEDGFIKSPPADGGWGYHPEYGWMYKPKSGQAGPK